ncbi:hypothetical protein DC094_13920 [Pelagibaculum spongiae]|uniref:Uncharacterized protein n=1 Tax=Pelagibaculum spongiae TaxID=2080658 RepID=A0A2V1H045_9GAMM|nr:hypothetical protein DC094_13920 [Pelagibaculum spongiae]
MILLTNHLVKILRNVFSKTASEDNEIKKIFTILDSPYRASGATNNFANIVILTSLKKSFMALFTHLIL